MRYDPTIDPFGLVPLSMARVQIAEGGNICDAIYLIMSVLDDMMRAGQWSAIDIMIEELNPETEDLDILLTVLTSTGHGAGPKKLKNRKKLYDESYDRLSVVITTPGVMKALKKDR